MVDIIKNASVAPSNSEGVFKLLMTLDEASETMNISKAMVCKLVRSGRMKVVHLGRCVRVPREEILRLCNVQSAEVENA